MRKHYWEEVEQMKERADEEAVAASEMGDASWALVRMLNAVRLEMRASSMLLDRMANPLPVEVVK